MKKHFTNNLTVIFAVLGFYFVAFKVLMKVKLDRIEIRSYTPPGGLIATACIRPRWEDFLMKDKAYGTTIFFAPLIGAEIKMKGKEYWEWRQGDPEPSWLHE